MVDMDRQHSCGVQVSESGRRSGIRQIIGRHVNGLNRMNCVTLIKELYIVAREMTKSMRK